MSSTALIRAASVGASSPNTVSIRSPNTRPGAVHQLARVGEVARAALVDDDLGRRIGRGQVADAAGVVEVDVGDRDRREVVRADAQRVECALHRGRRSRGAGLDQARAARSAIR